MEIFKKENGYKDKPMDIPSAGTLMEHTTKVILKTTSYTGNAIRLRAELNSKDLIKMVRKMDMVF